MTIVDVCGGKRNRGEVGMPSHWPVDGIGVLRVDFAGASRFREPPAALRMTILWSMSCVAGGQTQSVGSESTNNIVWRKLKSA